tara:strand:+ start:294 stop:653 length:360 start_codon:yes stop_codon:yes gene_type:complete
MLNRRLRLWLVVLLTGMWVTMPVLPAMSHDLAGGSQMAMEDCQTMPDDCCKDGDQAPCNGVMARCPIYFGCAGTSNFLSQNANSAGIGYQGHSPYGGQPLGSPDGRIIAPNLEPPILSA